MATKKASGLTPPIEDIGDLSLSANALEVLRRRYLRKNALGQTIETPAGLFRRVASAVAKVETDYGATLETFQSRADEFYTLMVERKFLPNTPTLMNAGGKLGQLSACFVLPVEDSMEGIFTTLKNSALIHKSGGGTGFSFSSLRPAGAMVSSTSGVASGPVSFMKVFNAATDAVKQGGVRRGANMGILRVDHPDISEFVSAKENTSELTNFNISVAVTDEFMRALYSDTEYSLIDPTTGQEYTRDGSVRRAQASKMWRRIVAGAWRTGEPGIIFIDRMNRANPTAPSEIIEATNPCGEQPLPPYDSCNLGSLNLGLFVEESPTPKISWDELRRATRLAVRFLDNVVDANRYPIPEIEAQSRKNRRIGLGVMGWADMLVLLGIPYDDERAFSLAEQVFEFISLEGKIASGALAQERGNFPNWAGSVYAIGAGGASGAPMRNATVTTVAPTGTISIIANCSSGIEPYFAIVYTRNVLNGAHLLEVNPLFEKIAHQRGFYSPSLMEKIATAASLAEVSEIPADVRALFRTAGDIAPRDHVRMQVAFQKHCDSSVSKTINLPTRATIEDVDSAYRLAYELGAKGVTVYRDLSRPEQVLSTRSGVQIARGEDTTSQEEPHSPLVEERPSSLVGYTEKVKTPFGNLYVTVNLRKELPFEVFATIGKSGQATMAHVEAICRLASLALRSGIPVSDIIRQLRGIGGAGGYTAPGAPTSLPDAIAKVLEKRFCPPDNPIGSTGETFDICPDCSGRLNMESGCRFCHDCGYSLC